MPGCYLLHGIDPGADEGPLDAGAPLLLDATSPPRADASWPGAPIARECVPMDAHDGRCACEAIDCDDLPPGAIRAWVWDGTACVPHRSCSCAGADCDARHPTRESCEAAFAACETSLCRSTGGRWVDETCGHYWCGVPPNELCVDPGCDCGPGRTYEEGVGCVESPSCTDEELCIASGGTFVPDAMCGLRCGEPSCTRDAPARVACDCGPGRTFYEGTSGCAPDSACSVDAASLCASTGGDWSALCCHSDCGRLCERDCAAPACDCGAGMRFDASRGCFEDPTCPAPDGERCDPWRDEPCIEPDAVCCRGEVGTRTVCRELACTSD
ncbi:MAG: hypothetical protein M3Y87_20600 [Myxococcota bacterium]|nr:hypothetical protein [Myxococcota bacterium]